MAELEAQYDLGEKEREVIAKRIRGLEDTDYAEWLSEFGLFAGAKKKAAPKNEPDGDEPEKGADNTDPMDPNEEKKSKKNAKASIEAALDDATANKGATPPNTPSIQRTINEEFADAFKLEDFQIKKTR